YRKQQTVDHQLDAYSVATHVGRRTARWWVELGSHAGETISRLGASLEMKRPRWALRIPTLCAMRRPAVVQASPRGGPMSSVPAHNAFRSSLVRGRSVARTVGVLAMAAGLGSVVGCGREVTE